MVRGNIARLLGQRNVTRNSSAFNKIKNSWSSFSTRSLNLVMGPSLQCSSTLKNAWVTTDLSVLGNLMTSKPERTTFVLKTIGNYVDKQISSIEFVVSVRQWRSNGIKDFFTYCILTNWTLHILSWMHHILSRMHHTKSPWRSAMEIRMCRSCRVFSVTESCKVSIMPRLFRGTYTMWMYVSL